MTKIPSVILGFALAGLLGAAVAVLAMSVGRSEADHVVAGDSRDSAEIEQLVARIDRLTARLEIMEKAPPMTAGGGAVAPAAVIPSEEGAAPLADAPLPEEIDNRVRELVKETEANRMKQWGSMFEGMARQRENGMLNRLAENHGLSDWQRTEMDKVLARRREAIGEFFRTMFGGQSDTPPDFTKVREKMDEVRTESEEEIKQILTPEQFEAFQADPASQMGRGGPMGGGGGGMGGR